MNYCFVPLCWATLAPPPQKQIVQYESNKPVRSKSTYRQSINQSTKRTYCEVLQPSLWGFVVILDWLIDWLIGWLILSTVGKIAPRGWFPSGSKKGPNTAGQHSIERSHTFSGNVEHGKGFFPQQNFLQNDAETVNVAFLRRRLMELQFFPAPSTTSTWSRRCPAWLGSQWRRRWAGRNRRLSARTGCRSTSTAMSTDCGL